MDEAVRKQTLQRLNYISGHLSGIKKMTEADRYCVDILKQTYAVRKALEKVETMILESHLKICVAERINQQNAPQLIDELLEIYRQSNR